MEHRFDYLLRDIIEIIKNDYAGFGEIEQKHDARYFVNTAGTAWKKGTLDELLFLRIVCQYLASLGDPALHFSMLDHADYENYGVGFLTRRCGDDLYVTKVLEDSRFQAGDRITALNSLSAGLHRAKFAKNFLIGDAPEREQWNGILKMTKHVKVEHADKSAEDLELKHFPLMERKPQLFLSRPKEGVLCIKVTCFDSDTAPLEELLSSNQKEINESKGLILDLRENEGGCDEGFLPLLPFVMDAPYQPDALLDAEGIVTNYSKANCQRRIREYRILKSQYQKAGDEEAVRVLDELIREFIHKSGKGWLKEEPEKIEEDFINPRQNIKKVLILTDTWCSGSGENFVDIARKSSRVTLVGRPTMGALDYTNYVTAVLDNTYVLTYPMGKKERVLKGERYENTGIPVDVCVPFTKEECSRDIVLEKALEMV